jgi:hypothetical protein
LDSKYLLAAEEQVVQVVARVMQVRQVGSQRAQVPLVEEPVSK